MLRDIYINSLFLPKILAENDKNLIRHFISHNIYIGDGRAYLEKLRTYLSEQLEATHPAAIARALMRKKTPQYTDEILLPTITRLENSPQWKPICRLESMLIEVLSGQKKKNAPFSFASTRYTKRQLEQSILAVLTKSLPFARKSVFARNILGILLFHYAIFKLASIEAIRKLYSDFIPKKNTRGKSVQDKAEQIRYLIEQDTAYHKKYYTIMRHLFPVVMAQLSRLSTKYSLGMYILMTRDKLANKSAYLKLLANFSHDALHAGLGVFIGLKHNIASERILEGAKRLLRATGITKKNNQKKKS
jgi:hypothetical protein